MSYKVLYNTALLINEMNLETHDWCNIVIERNQSENRIHNALDQYMIDR